ncbi:putative membrane protein [Candidatus Rhodobacter oscarellae]|uniref:Putative membrane protein n=1 Tax=Candidatus Rhodobacter oscarellae TaxID=1675527 RepID=A0A0J9H1W4_9RHOB|nr:DMT family transporter [Candidatus Rhodobacter lobularis]KMW59708.1 putative membrane protein [Candidatus Rhodobacter lobularis]
MNPSRGILLMVTAISLFSIMGALVKAADRIPAGEIVFFRAFCALPVLVVWLALRGGLREGLRVQSWRGHAVRAIAGSCAMGLGFYGIKLIPLPEATAIRFVTPILVVVFAALILGEVIRRFRVTAVLVGLVGVMIIIWPRLDLELGDAAFLGASATLVSAGLAAFAQVILKGMAGKESTTAIVFYFLGTASTLSLLSLPFGWVWPVGVEWVWLVGAGLFGGLGQLFVTASYKHADAGTLAPFTYVGMIWALGLGYVFFGEVPTLAMLGGAALVIASGIAIVLRERALGHQRTAEQKVRSLLKNG